MKCLRFLNSSELVFIPEFIESGELQTAAQRTSHPPSERT
jgi:hypothetical protein